jgi:hypothetical protein
MVRRVHSYLKKKCSVADSERKTVEGRTTDALGYIDGDKFKTWYLCEIKVNPSDLLKGVSQIHDTAFRFKQAHKGDIVIPVLAFPTRLQQQLIQDNKWNSHCDLCKRSDVAIWIIEQSTVREFRNPTTAKTKEVAPKATKSKTMSKKRTTAKATKADTATRKVTTARATNTRQATTKTAGGSRPKKKVH